MKIFTAALIAITLYSSALLAGPEDSYDKTTDYKKIEWMDRGKNAAKSKLKDPDSAQFRKVYFHNGADNIPVTCGEVNSKNGFGGYGGYQKFISAGKPELTWLEEQVADFSNIWSRVCL